MMIGYQFERNGEWSSPKRADDYKDAAVIIVTERDNDLAIDAYAILERKNMNYDWKRIGGARRENRWAH